MHLRSASAVVCAAPGWVCRLDQKGVTDRLKTAFLRQFDLEHMSIWVQGITFFNLFRFACAEARGMGVNAI